MTEPATTTERERIVRDWLLEKHTTLWGRFYDILQDESLEAAAAWFVAEMADVQSYIERRLETLSESRTERS